MPTEYHAVNETQTRKKQKGIKNQNDELNIVQDENRIKNQKLKNIKFILNVPDVNNAIWDEFDKGCYCQNCE